MNLNISQRVTPHCVVIWACSTVETCLQDVLIILKLLLQNYSKIMNVILYYMYVSQFVCQGQIIPNTIMCHPSRMVNPLVKSVLYGVVKYMNLSTQTISYH